MLACLFYPLSKPVSPNKKSLSSLKQTAKLLKKNKTLLHILPNLYIVFSLYCSPCFNRVDGKLLWFTESG